MHTTTTTTTTTTTAIVLAESPAITSTLDSYASWCAGQRKLRKRAIETYMRVISRFADHLGPDSTIADILLLGLGAAATAYVLYVLARGAK